MIELPRRQKQLHDLLLGRGDVFIEDLYREMEGPARFDTNQRKQRWLSPYIAMLNQKLVDQGLRVEPGALKCSYRLVALAP